VCMVDADLKVYGVDNLRIADGSIMPRVTTGNTMAPCVIIGERAAEILRIEYKFGSPQEFDRTRILGCFLEDDKFGPGCGHVLSLQKEIP
jgi:choline dehydrogenase-like flavoprotein